MNGVLTYILFALIVIAVVAVKVGPIVLELKENFFALMGGMQRKKWKQTAINAKMRQKKKAYGFVFLLEKTYKKKKQKKTVLILQRKRKNEN